MSEQKINKKEVYLELVATKPKKTLKFYNLEGLEKWLLEEKNAWGWAAQFSGNQPLRSVHSHLMAPLNAISGSVTRIKRAGANQVTIDKEKEILKSSFNRYYTSNKGILASSKYYKFISNYIDEEPELASFMAAYFTNAPSVTFNSSYGASAALKCELYEQKIEGASEVDKENYLSLCNEMDSKVVSYTENLDKLNNDYVDHVTTFENKLGEQSEEFENTYADITKKLKELEKTYNLQLALKAPVKYWSDMKKKHVCSAWLASALLVLFAWVGICYLEKLYMDVLWVSNPELWKIWRAILNSSVFGWVLFLVSKFILSRIHLASDAGDRATMVNTFLAMEKDEHVFKEEDRHLILGPLFSPPETGLIKGMSNPPHFEILNKILKD